MFRSFLQLARESWDKKFFQSLTIFGKIVWIFMYVFCLFLESFWNYAIKFSDKHSQLIDKIFFKIHEKAEKNSI